MRRYPEPWQLEAFADEPLIFTEVNDLTLRVNDGTLSGGEGSVGYTFEPDFIRVTPQEDGLEQYEVSQNPDATLTHVQVWTQKLDVTVEDNTVSATAYTVQNVPEKETVLAEAFWSLSEVTISV